MTEQAKRKETTDERAARILAERRKENPKLRAALLTDYPERSGEGFLVRLAPYTEFSALIGKAKNDGAANETILANFLIDPPWDPVEAIDDVDKWPAGFVAKLAKDIVRANGFTDGEATIKKL